MFGVDTTELLIVALAALIFIGPKELPGAMRTVGRWVGQARGHARHFTAGIENMMREAELDEMEKRWREENERIMREHPVALPYVGAGEGGSSYAAPAVLPETSLPEGSGGAIEQHEDEPSLPLPPPGHHERPLP